MTDAQVKGNAELVMSYMHEFYFESAAMILTLITVGKMLEAHSKGKTTNALKALLNLAPKKATLLIDGKETEVTVDKVKKAMYSLFVRVRVFLLTLKSQTAVQLLTSRLLQERVFLSIKLSVTLFRQVLSINQALLNAVQRL